MFSTSDSSLGRSLSCALLATGAGVPSGALPSSCRRPLSTEPHAAPPSQNSCLTRAGVGRGQASVRAGTGGSSQPRRKGHRPLPAEGRSSVHRGPDGKPGTCCKAKLPKAVPWTSTRTVGSAEQVHAPGPHHTRASRGHVVRPPWTVCRINGNNPTVTTIW